MDGWMECLQGERTVQISLVGSSGGCRIEEIEFLVEIKVIWITFERSKNIQILTKDKGEITPYSTGEGRIIYGGRSP